MLINLNTIKTHLNIDASYTDDDQYLEYLEGVAEEIVQKHIDRTFEDIMATEGEIPQPLLHTILLFVGNLYENRESVAYNQVVDVPNSLTYILSLYRDYNNSNI